MRGDDAPAANAGFEIAAVLPSADAMRSFGRGLASLLVPGDAILLSGRLGAGKTTLVQGIADGLGAGERVTSPTFVLAREYDSDIRLRHVDLYRLERVDEVIGLGLDEIFDSEWVTVVEWGEGLREDMAGSYLWVEIEFGGEGDNRDVRIIPVGQDWGERRAQIEGALSSAAE